MSTYAGTVDEKRAKASYNDEGDSVLNIVVKTMKTLVGNIQVPVKRTITLFRGQADTADDLLEPGVHVVFSEVVRNPRVFETGRGKKVETVDLIAEGFTVIKPKDFKEHLEVLMEANVPDSEFTFTDEDRTAAAAVTDTIDAKDDDIPFGD